MLHDLIFDNNLPFCPKQHPFPSYTLTSYALPPRAREDPSKFLPGSSVQRWEGREEREAGRREGGRGRGCLLPAYLWYRQGAEDANRIGSEFHVPCKYVTLAEN